MFVFDKDLFSLIPIEQTPSDTHDTLSCTCIQRWKRHQPNFAGSSTLALDSNFKVDLSCYIQVDCIFRDTLAKIQTVKVKKI